MRANDQRLVKAAPLLVGPRVKSATKQACRRVYRSRQLRSLKYTVVMNSAAETESSNKSRGKSTSPQQRQAKDVVLRYYDFYNAGNIDGVMSLMAEDCKYHDMIYSDPFEGHAAIRDYFEKVNRIVPSDLKFFVEEISGGDPHFTGVKWHVDLNGNEFPFSRGVSFYEVNEEGKIVAARDCVEPALKPGSSALQGLRVMAPIVRKLGPKANPAVLKNVPIKTYLIFAFYAAYCAYVFFGRAAPGEPVYRTPPETWKWIINDSLNFFYVNIFAQWSGLPSIPTPAGNPVSEALFNFVNAWSLMFWPLFLADPKRHRIGRKVVWWTGIMFLTNVFFVPYMALRERPPPPEERQQEIPRPLPSFSRLFGGVGAVVAAVSLVWLVSGRPETGGLDARWEYAVTQFNNNRAFWAFVLDLGFYTVWQAVLMRDCGAPKRYQYVPFFGLAAWLVAEGGSVIKGLKSGFWDPLDNKG